MFTRNSNTSKKTIMNTHQFWCCLPKWRHFHTLEQENIKYKYRPLPWRAKTAIWMPWRTIYTSAPTQVFKYIKNTLNLIYGCGSAREDRGLNQSRSTAVISGWARREEQLSRSEFNPAVSNWFRRHASHKLNSLNSIRLTWSTASEPGLINGKCRHC